MSWFRVDDTLFDHPKWILALQLGGSDAVHLWLRLGTWCSRHLTDGRVPAHVASTMTGPRGVKSMAKAWRALIDAALIERQGDGSVALHDYLDYNPSRAKVIAERGRKAQNKQDQRDRENVTGDRRAGVTGDSPRPVPSRPLPSPECESPDCARAHVATLEPEPEPESTPEAAPEHKNSAPRELPEVSCLRVVAARSRTVSVPDGPPPRDYLDEAVQAGVSREQAASTWEHYQGAGLPLGGVERLYRWLVKRAKERTNQLARAPAAPARAAPGSDLDTTSAATAFRLANVHGAYAAEHGLAPADLERAVSEYRRSATARRLDTLEQERDFMARLRHWVASGSFIADGPLPKRLRGPLAAQIGARLDLKGALPVA